MAKREITVFYAWQSDRDREGNQHFIRIALDDADLPQYVTREDQDIDTLVLVANKVD